MIWDMGEGSEKFLPFYGEKKIYVVDTFIDKLCITVSELEFMAIKMYKFAIMAPTNKTES